MPHFETANLFVHYTETGCGETVVLLHAGGASSSHWRKVTPYLQNRYRLLAPDLIGFGESGFRSGREVANHDDQAALVQALLRHEGQKRVHIVGHSFGGAAAVRMAIRYPETVKSLVLIEPTLTPLLRFAGANALYEESRVRALAFTQDADAGRDDAAWRRFIDQHNGDGTWDSLSDRSRTRLLGVTAQTAAAYKANLNNPTDLVDLAELSKPVLVLCGDETDDPYRRICDIVQEYVPRCRTETIAGAGHMSPLSHPAPVALAIEDHLDAQRPAWGVRLKPALSPNF